MWGFLCMNKHWWQTYHTWHNTLFYAIFILHWSCPRGCTFQLEVTEQKCRFAHLTLESKPNLEVVGCGNDWRCCLTEWRALHRPQVTRENLSVWFIVSNKSLANPVFLSLTDSLFSFHASVPITFTHSVPLVWEYLHHPISFRIC